MEINGKKVITNGTFAFDGCHKIYIIESLNEEKEAVKLGYQIKDLKELEDTWKSSCPLRFISSWDLQTNYVSQCEDLIITNEEEYLAKVCGTGYQKEE